MYKTTNMIMKNPIYLLSKNNATAVISNYEEIINNSTISPIVESRSKRAIITFNNN